MEGNRLNVISGDDKNPLNSIAQKSSRREEIRAKFERLWLKNPSQFDPHRNCMEELRIQRTFQLIRDFLKPQDQLVADLGCGWGVLSHRLTQEGATVHAVDVASNALKLLQERFPKIHTFKQDCLPKTLLNDDTYDLVLSTDVVAFLEPKDFRLYMAELSRLVRTNGYVVCSTPLDFSSVDAVERFAALAETEFKIEKWVFSYHRLYIQIAGFIEAPSNYVKGKKDQEFRHEQLKKRSGFSKEWYRMNSTTFLYPIWFMVQLLTNPLGKFLKRNQSMMTKLEKICRALWDESGISHAIFIAKRRPLASMPEVLPRETKHKKQLWE